MPPKLSVDPIRELQLLAMKSQDRVQCLNKARIILEKDSSNKDAWQWRAICEFESGLFGEAKISFEKLQALDPANVVAGNYLKDLNSGNILINVEKSGILEQDFKSNLDFILDTEVMLFNYAYKIPARENSPETITADYTSSQTFNQAVSYIEKTIKEAGLEYTIDKVSSRTSFLVSGKKVPSDYHVSVFKQEPVKIIIDFTKRNE